MKKYNNKNKCIYKIANMSNSVSERQQKPFKGQQIYKQRHLLCL